jgi:hypothetical protein
MEQASITDSSHDFSTLPNPAYLIDRVTLGDSDCALAGPCCSTSTTGWQLSRGLK